MTDQELVHNLIAWWDESRLESHGGYPSDWQIWHGAVIWASVDHDQAPTLQIQDLQPFLEENMDYVIDAELEADLETYEQKRNAVEEYFSKHPPLYA